MPYLSKILIYPIKSLDGVEVPSAQILEGGALVNDREFALFDASGKFVNAKRTEKIHLLRSRFDLAARTVTLRVEGQPQSHAFHLDADRPALESWFSEYFGYPVTLQQNLHMGFPDDTTASGATVVSVETLKLLSSWFPGTTLEEIRQRVRANLEISDASAFWEDQLMKSPGQLMPFQMGEVNFLGSHACARCIVLTRNPWLGERDRDFQKEFIAKRKETLPQWAIGDRFDHFYRLTLNTQVPATEAGKILRLGDEVSVGRGNEDRP
jgi:uncharacterized protein